MDRKTRTDLEIAPARARMRAFARLCAAATLPLAGLASAMAIAASGNGGSAGGALTTAGTSGPISIQDSREGAAILTAGPMKPGDSTQGTVTITNAGDPAEVRLSESHLVDQLGPFGGALSGRLLLTVQDLAKPESPVYSGPLGSLPSVALGGFAKGEARTYRFTATLPNGGTPPSSSTGDNLFQDSQMTAEFDWTATGKGSTPATGNGSTPATGKESTPPPATPVLTFTASRSQRFGKGVLVHVGCNLACPVRITGSVPIAGSRRKYPLSTGIFTVPAGSTINATLNFPKATRDAMAKALARRKKVTATVTATMAGATAQNQTIVITRRP